MTVSSMTELRLAFVECDPDRILGTAECSWVDFKSSPYLLATDKGCWELCKDVAAFANSGGGCIVIGIATTKDANDTTERATGLRAVPKEMINREQVRDKISVGVYPPIDGLDITIHPSGDATCFLLIFIPAQTTDVQPFLVRYLIDVDDRNSPHSLRSAARSLLAPRDRCAAARSRFASPPTGFDPLRERSLPQGFDSRDSERDRVYVRFSLGGTPTGHFAKIDEISSVRSSLT